MTALSSVDFCLPEHITPEIFLGDYWQKKPLVIRNGLPEIVGQFEPQDIIELAQNEDVTARLVKTFSDDDWKVFFSPLSERISKNYQKNGRCWFKIWSNGRLN